MPLDKSGSKASVGKNIAAELGSGRPKKQAIAIALNVARQHGADIPKPKAMLRYRDGAQLTKVHPPHLFTPKD